MSFVKPTNIYLLGTAERGITGVPTKIENEMQLVSYFGDKGSLVNGYRKLKDITNTPEIYLCKVNGTHSSSYAHIIHENKIMHNAVEFKSIFSSDEYGKITILLTDDFMQVIHNNKTLEYDFKVYPTIHSLFKAVNDDASNLLCPITVTNYTLEEYEHPAKCFVSCNKPIIEITGANSGLNDNKNLIYTGIKDTLSFLEKSPIDVLVFCDCYVDDTPIDNEESPIYLKDIYSNDGYEKLSFYMLMLDFCISQCKSNIITKGVIGFRPLIKDVDVNKVKEYKKLLDNLTNSSYISNEYLSLVSVCYGDLYYDNGGMIDNHYIAYAGVLSSELYKSNITNIDYGDNVSVRTYLKSDEAKEIALCRFSIIRYSPLTKKAHIVNGTTQAVGIYSCEYSIRTMQVFFKIVEANISPHIGDVLCEDDEAALLESVKNSVNSLTTYTPVTMCSHNTETDDNGNTTIQCIAYIPGFLDPLKFSLSLN